MRRSGILMHITSLPGPYGVGTMGKEAYAFVDFLAKAGQSYWQILPLNPTGYGDSPYQSCSAFAGNPYLIDLDRLVERGYLTREELDSYTWCHSETAVDFGLLYENRRKVLRLAFSRFKENEAYIVFLRKSGDWLWDYSLYMALKDKHNGAPWYTWEDGLKHRDADCLWQARQELKEEIEYYCFVQYLFYRQWKKLKVYAKGKGIKIIGDVPIYVPLDSVEVWTDPKLFMLDNDLNPEAVAGVPPDGFTADGQLWGNPLYRWEKHEADGFAWWIHRLKAATKRYDVIRLDHFRGFESFWSVPYGDSTARNGHWVKGPDMKFISAIKKAMPDTEFIAEDLGYLTEEVLDMKNNSGFPGMKVLEFAFDSREPSEYLPHTYEANTVCYVGTHDNMTMAQWFREADPAAVQYAKEYMALTEGEGFVWGALRTAMASVSQLCVNQMQDFLNLDGWARMNFPGTFGSPNWCWRAEPGAMNDALAERIYKMTALYGRVQK